MGHSALEKFELQVFQKQNLKSGISKERILTDVSLDRQEPGVVCQSPASKWQALGWGRRAVPGALGHGTKEGHLERPSVGKANNLDIYRS